MAQVSATIPTSGSGTFSPSPSLPPSNPSSTPGPTSQAALSNRPNRGAIAGGIVGGLLFLFLATAAWIVYKRRRRNRLSPSAEFLSNPAAYPFARAGFGANATKNEKVGAFGGTYGGAGQGAANQTRFKPLSTDSHQGMLSEKRPQIRFRDENLIDPLPPPSEPEVLYSTPLRVSTVPTVPAPGSTPGTPTTPNGRRIPFGTGTFQFPPRPVQPAPK